MTADGLETQPAAGETANTGGVDEAGRVAAWASSRPGRGKAGCIPWVLMACVVVVFFWEVMSTWSRKANEPYEITAQTLAPFSPTVHRARLARLSVRESRLEPHVAAFRLEKTGKRPVLTRLVHGYNMCDCMRIKHYEVVLLRDTREGGASVECRVSREGRTTNSQQPTTNNQQPTLEPAEPSAPHSAIGNRQSALPVQVWRLTSPTGDRSVWVTSMLTAYDFAATDVDTRSMDFPKVGTPDDPNFNPQGFRLKSLRHPIRNLRAFVNAEWNKSRCDWMTFLGLRKPAWASRSMFTLVSAAKGPRVQPKEEPAVIEHVLETHAALHAELTRWRAGELNSR